MNDLSVVAGCETMAIDVPVASCVVDDLFDLALPWSNPCRIAVQQSLYRIVNMVAIQGVVHAPQVRAQSTSTIISPVQVRLPAPLPCLFTQPRHAHVARVSVGHVQRRLPGKQVPTTTCAAAASEGAGMLRVSSGGMICNVFMHVAGLVSM